MLGWKNNMYATLIEWKKGGGEDVTGGGGKPKKVKRSDR